MRKRDTVQTRSGKPGVVTRAAEDGSWVDLKTKSTGPAKRVSTKNVKHI